MGEGMGRKKERGRGVYLWPHNSGVIILEGLSGGFAVNYEWGRGVC